MTLLWLEGFESLGDTIGNAPAPTGVLASKYKTVVSESSFDIDTGRNGSGRSLLFGITNSRFHTADFSTTDRTLIVGFAFKYNTPGFTAYLCNLFSAAAWMMTLWFDGYGKMKFLNNASAEIVAVDNVYFVPGRWYWVEFKVYVDNSVGTIDMRVGEKNVLSFTGDTQFGANNYVNGVNFKDNTGMDPAIDDFYVCDGSGTDNNDFLGNVKVATLRPNGDSAVAWTPLGAGTNYVEVDESQHDAATTYVSDSTANNQDLYDFDNLSGVTPINGVMINSVAALSVLGSETMQIIVKSGTTQSNSANKTVASTAYKTFTDVVEQDPNASAAWTDTTIDAALFGDKYI